MIGPARRDQRRTHLDASAVPVERALLARADSPEPVASSLIEAAHAAGITDQQLDIITDIVSCMVFNQFRLLAEELHWW